MHRIVRAQDAIVRPWKNGRGETLEIARFPTESDFSRGDFHWRLSRAVVAEDGPFSPFPGFHRTLVLLEGDGLVIDHGESAPPRTLLPLRPYGFEGEWPTSARLLGSTVSDFNVIVAREHCSADVRMVDGGTREVRPSATCEHVLLYVVDGALCAVSKDATGRGERRVLETGDCLWIDRSDGSPSPQRLALDPVTAQFDPIFVAIFVQIEPENR